MPDPNDSHLTKPAADPSKGVLDQALTPPPAVTNRVATIQHAVNSFATHRGNRVQITLVHDDDTADVQRVDRDGKVELDANNQPQWTPKVPLAELS